MKKAFLLLFCALCVSEVAFGQLEVKSDGRVNITPSGNYGLYGYSSGIVTINPKMLLLDPPIHSAGVKGSG
ncbi:MAG: hypothetical protein LBN95_09490, partial [Prevotellaceae bacterium]|nr:hypothetical protein [Prevotellaceae bacterium]